jgi:hypothetical protein
MSDVVDKREIIRNMSEEEFIEKHGSGTCRKNKRVGLLYKKHYLEERVAFEFGYGFKIEKIGNITLGFANSEPDCHPITEVGWFADRWKNWCAFDNDDIEVKYIIEKDGTQGVGFVVNSNAHWIPKNHIIYCIISKCKKDIFKKAKNPC